MRTPDTYVADLNDRVVARAAARTAEVLARVFGNPTEPPVPCAKCTTLRQAYVLAKRLIRWLTGDRDPSTRPEGHGDYVVKNLFSAEANVHKRRAAFHSAACTCGLELWRGKKWRAVQGHEYQLRWQLFQQTRLTATTARST